MGSSTHLARRLVVAAGLVAAALAAHGQPAQAGWVTLHLDAAEDHVRLVWITGRWPMDVIGFDLMRAPATADGAPSSAWEKLNQTLHRPSVDPDRVWSDIHPDPTQQLRLKAMLIGGLASGEVEARDDVMLMARLRGLNPEEERGLRATLLFDTERALMAGFGAVVPRDSAAAGMVYGLFEVREGGARATRPVAVASDVYAPPDDPRFDLEVHFEAMPPDGLMMSWTCPADLYEGLGLRPFEVQLETVGDDGEPVLQGLGIALMERDGDVMRARFGQLELDLTQPHRFVVVTHHLFGRERHRSVHTFVPAPPDPSEPLPPPSGVQAFQVPGTEVSLSWSYPAEAEDRLKGFDVERREGADGPYTALVSGLSPSARTAVDGAPKTLDTLLAYQVVAVGLDGQRERSFPVTVLYQDARLPPRPSGLTGVVEVRDGVRKVALRWDGPGPGDDVTQTWILASDEARRGELIAQTWTGVLTQPGYDYPIETPAARPYTFEVRGVSAQGLRGEAATVTVDTPSARLPEVVIDRFELIDGGRRVRVHWRYEAVANLVGFEVFVDGRTEKVGPDARQWESPAVLRAGSEHTYALQATASDGRRSRRSALRAYRMPSRHGLPITPRGLRVVAETGQRQGHLKISWERHPDGRTFFYVVRVGRDGAEPEEIARGGADDPTWTRHPYDPAVPARYQVEVVGQTLRGLTSPPATAEFVVTPAGEAAAPEVETPPEAGESPEEDGPPWAPLGVGALLALLVLGLWVARRRAGGDVRGGD